MRPIGSHLLRAHLLLRRQKWLFGTFSGLRPLGDVAEKFHINVSKEDAELRLDQLLAKHIPEMSRRKARKFIEIGGVFIDSKRVKVSGRVPKLGQKVTIHIGGAVGALAKPNAFALDILFEDEHIVVINKPSGLITAPTPESDRGNLKYLLETRADKPCQIFVVHRLDKDTSGILVMAKSNEANIKLSEGFKKHIFKRRYLAVVKGHLEEATLKVSSPIKKKSATTHLKRLRLLKNATEIEAVLDTGRTHQIRLHCLSIGHEVVGDSLYGTKFSPKPPQMALHATHLGIQHPMTGEELSFDADYPAALNQWVEQLT